MNITGDAAEIISGFTAPDLPSPENYRFGMYLTLYLKSLIDAGTLTVEDRAAAAGIGMAKFPRFEAAWLGLKRPIPRVWFAAVGGDYDALDKAAEADGRAYDAVTDLAHPANWYTERLMPAIYRRRELPKGLSEAEAVRYLAEHAKASRFACCLGCGGIRTYWFNADGTFFVDIHRPKIKMTRAWINIGGESITPTSRIG